MMKMTFGKFVLAIGAGTMLSCGNGKGVEDDYKSLIGKEIEIPYEKFVPMSSEASAEASCKWTYVSFIDSLECTPCHMSSVHNWDRIQDVFEEKGTDVKIVLVYCPRMSTVERMTENYNISGCKRTVYIDLKADFLKCNPQIPENRKMHTVLLDSLNRVVLIGDPTRNRKIEEMLHEIIN